MAIGETKRRAMVVSANQEKKHQEDSDSNKHKLREKYEYKSDGSKCEPKEEHEKEGNDNKCKPEARRKGQW